MNNTALKILAGLLLIASLIVAYLGFHLSGNRPTTTQTVVVQSPPPVPTEQVVVAARAIKKGQSIKPEDLEMKGIVSPSSQAFRTPDDIVGRVALNTIEPGTTLLPALLAADTMANLLNAGERAMAVQVDEVIGLGGYAEPGDRVDVLLFIPANRETGDASSAQVIIHNARLLTLGEANQMAVEEAKRQSDNSVGATSSPPDTKPSREAGHTPRSAVLAIPEADITRLMLAASSGQLRLALRPRFAAPDLNLASTKASDATPSRRTITISDIAPGVKKPATAPIAEDSGIIIQEGSKERRLAKNEVSTSQP